MKGTDLFKKRIKEYLEQRAADDSEFAEKYGKKMEQFKKKAYHKDRGEEDCIDECCAYIFGEVSASGCGGFDDDEIFCMAVHYFDEETVKIKPNRVQGVVIDRHVDLTEAEKAEARQQAIKAYQNEVVENLKRKPKTQPKEDTKEEQPQLSLFDL